MKTKILAIVLCAVSLMASCSSRDAETEKQIKQVEKFNAEQEKIKNSGVPAEKLETEKRRQNRRAVVFRFVAFGGCKKRQCQ